MDRALDLESRFLVAKLRLTAIRERSRRRTGWRVTRVVIASDSTHEREDVDEILAIDDLD